MGALLRRGTESTAARDYRTIRATAASFASIGLALAQTDPVALRQPIERSAVNAEQLRRQLLVPARLTQDAPDMTGHDSAQAQRRAHGVGRRGRVEALGRQILGPDDRVRGERHRALDG